MLERRSNIIYEERPQTVGSTVVVPASSISGTLSGGMIVQQQSNLSHQQGNGTRVVLQPPTLNQSSMKLQNNSTPQFTSTDANNGVYTWQNVSSNSYNEPQMYYASEIFSSSSNNTDGSHLKTATIIEQVPQQHQQQIITTGNMQQMKSLTSLGGGGTMHHLPDLGHNQMQPLTIEGGSTNTANLHHSNLNVVQSGPGTIIFSNNGNFSTLQGNQMINTSTVKTQEIEHVVSSQNQSPGNSRTVVSNQSVVKKKKRPVKSKKKNINSEQVFEPDVDISVYPDDMIYIRIDGNDPLSSAGLQHTVNINETPKHDSKAMRLLNPRPEYNHSGIVDSDEDIFPALAGAGVWEYGKVWNHHLTIKFLEKLHLNRKRMFSRDSRKNLYIELSLMFQSEDNKEITMEELEKKWCSLLSSYKRNQIRMKRGEEVSWGYYQVMDEILTEGKEIRKANRERPSNKKRVRGRRLSDEELETRETKAMCSRKNKKVKKQLNDRLEQIKLEREFQLEEAKKTWDSVRLSVSGVNQSINSLNTSVVMLGHALTTFLTNLQQVDEEKLKKAVSTFSK